MFFIYTLTTSLTFKKKKNFLLTSETLNLLVYFLPKKLFTSMLALIKKLIKTVIQYLAKKLKRRQFVFNVFKNRVIQFKNANIILTNSVI